MWSAEQGKMDEMLQAEEQRSTRVKHAGVKALAGAGTASVGKEAGPS